MQTDWSLDEVRAIYDLPLLELVVRAATVHRREHVVGEVQLNQLINIKPGGCAEDCAYCAQSSRYQTHVKAEPLMSVAEVVQLARKAKSSGATRVCLGVAWREVRNGPIFDRILEMVSSVRSLGLEVCCTLGMLTSAQAKQLKAAGLYAYNHNLDTSKEYYEKVISTRTYQERLQTLQHVRDAGITVCCGGILGLGESNEDRLKLLHTLATLHPHPESVPINLLVPVPGTPLGEQPPVSVWDVARVMATARILMPKSSLRLTAGRNQLSVSEQAICYLAGANSVFISETLLTTPNPSLKIDQEMFRTLGIQPKKKAQRVPRSCVPNFMELALENAKMQGTLRTLRQSNDLIDLTSNDYLGFARSVELCEAIEQEYRRLIQAGGVRPVVGTTGSRLLTGNSEYLEALERQISLFHKAEAGLLFNTGYLANTGLLSCVASESDQIILDSQVHASTWDGARLSRAKLRVFGHNDLEQLRWQLGRAYKAGGNLFVCIESLYSLSGDTAPLREISDLCDEFGARLIVDEAHATGVLGPGGRGLIVKERLCDRVFARIHTFGKALGTHGGIVLGSPTLRDYLINFSRPLIYTTAFGLHTQVSIRCAYERLQEADSARVRLNELIAYFHLSVEQTHIPVVTTNTPIQAIMIPGAQAATQAAAACRAQGLDVRAIVHPTVRAGSEQLRVCLHVFNTKDEIDMLIAALAGELCKSLSA